MEFRQPEPVSLSNPLHVHEPTNLKSSSALQDSRDATTLDGQREEKMEGNRKQCVGVLDVCIHSARDIHNICIYHKQDVYAKLILTSDPETTVSTQIINGGGRNPVFNEKIRLNVQTIDASLKCEIWMLSRVRNFLQDQLLGFTLVPLCDVLIENGKIEQEFPLTSSDLFHSPAGFVQLTLAYTGETPEVLEISTASSALVANVAGDISVSSDSEPCELEKIEFPDPAMVKENERMVSEYFGIPCADMDCKTSETTDITNNSDHLDSNIGASMVESFTKDESVSKVSSEIGGSPSAVSANESPSSLIPAGSQSNSNAREAPKSPDQYVVSSLKGKIENVGKVENGSSEERVGTFPQPVIKVNAEPELKLNQQEIVDMYMKSMQQFTEALAKMKLPLDIENDSAGKNNPASSGSSTSIEKADSSKSNGPSPRVFYGSRAFF